MLQVTRYIDIPASEIGISAVRSQGAGGQNVNKVSTAVHLRFDINASSLPETLKQRLLKLDDKRISKQGVIVIKAQRTRSLEKNRNDALDRLRDIILSANSRRRKRIATKPGASANNRRLDSKTRRGRIKYMRRKPAAATD